MLVVNNIVDACHKCLIENGEWRTLGVLAGDARFTEPTGPHLFVLPCSVGHSYRASLCYMSVAYSAPERF